MDYGLPWYMSVERKQLESIGLSSCHAEYNSILQIPIAPVLPRTSIHLIIELNNIHGYKTYYQKSTARGS